VGGVTECLRFPGSAEFHPLMYLEGLAAAVERHGGKIYEGTKAWKTGKCCPAAALAGWLDAWPRLWCAWCLAACLAGWLAGLEGRQTAGVDCRRLQGLAAPLAALLPWRASKCCTAAPTRRLCWLLQSWTCQGRLSVRVGERPPESVLQHMMLHRSPLPAHVCPPSSSDCLPPCDALPCLQRAIGWRLLTAT
jgi:hypothetical protein